MIKPHDASLESFVAASGQSERDFWLGVQDAMTEALVFVSPDRRLVHANARAREVLALDPEDAIGRSCTEVLDCPQCECRCRLYETGVIDDVEVTIYTPEPRVFRKNGRLVRDSKGRVIGGIEAFRDVTREVRDRDELKERDHQLLQERRCTDTLLESVSEGVVTLDGDLRIRDFSESMTRLTGLMKSEAFGRTFFDIFSSEEVGHQPSIEELPARKIEATVRTSSGEVTRVRIAFLPLRYGSEELMALVRPADTDRPEASSIERQYGFQGMISRSPKMLSLFRLLENVADSDASVLVEGESGAGKELVARAIHSLGSRRRQPFYAVNCATFTGSLLLSELFGHERGAFTGAVKTQRGKLELAEGGTLLLDEVTEIPIQHQALLLRVLESRRFERLGGSASTPFSARVIAAANRSLQEAIADRQFRSDLFFRLSVVPLRVPPLRERPEDIELLLEYFLINAERPGRPAPKLLSPTVLSVLEAYPWPGNVRELKNLVEYFCFLCEDEVRLEHLPRHILERGTESTKASPVSAERRVIGADERQRILQALREARFKKAKAAELLGIDRTTLWRKMRRLGIDG